MKRSRFLARIRTSTAGISGRPSRPGPIPNTNWACRSSPRNRPRAFTFDVLDATKIVPEELVPLVPGRPAGAQSQPRQLLCGNRAGGVLRRARGSRHRLLERSAAGRPHSLLRGYPDLAAGRAELSRDPNQRARRAGAQQPARRHAPSGDSPRAVSRMNRTPSPVAVRSRPVRRDSCPSRSRVTRANTRFAERLSASRTTTRRRRCSGIARRTSRNSTSSAHFGSSSLGCKRPPFGSEWSRA